jgi:hypothetical protein
VQDEAPHAPTEAAEGLWRKVLWRVEGHANWWEGQNECETGGQSPPASAVS